ncbi:WhiB family transcriptional regulator [Streptomyces sp. A3M-1-3]|uniref:WhiB family transcriptional regulator n=1 Tax=Streptomyces sp. A3M-1-3 TaxID=2962044 RepID=UPI0020B65C7D|nr:WhiB family transcriptional regulator [Streptomyces sp. A3M-1-3]MCP3817804.1 WhiB family transcriptional regulator [Streptomyces sp. A3M-1-3]
MKLYTHRAPETLGHPDDWRTLAACAGMAELFIPRDERNADSSEPKRICRGCPVKTTCLTEAMKEEKGADQHRRAGVRGGLNPAERAALHRRRAAGRGTTVEEAMATALSSGPTLREFYDKRTAPAADGHKKWTVSSTTHTFKGRIYTPMKIAFIVGHGREPTGIVRAACGMTGCVAPEHLTDDEMRRARKAAA